MILGIGVGEQIVGDAQIFLRLQKSLVKVLEDFARGLALFVSAHHNRRAVAITAADYDHPIAL